jgi:hypothetical protein
VISLRKLLFASVSSLTLLTSIGSVVMSLPSPADAATALPQGASVFTPVSPSRLTDGRGSFGYTRLSDTLIRVSITGRAGIPVSATAAALTLTVVSAPNAGFLSVYPAGTARPNVSAVNFVQSATVANTAIVPLSGIGGVTGSVDVYTSSPSTAVLVDVTGFFAPPASQTPSAGRFTPLGPTRALDTRNAAQVLSGRSVAANLTSVGVPATASAVALNVTGTGVTSPGFFTVYPWNTPRPDTSSVNFDQAGQTRAAFVITPVNAGAIEVYVSASSHVIVDVLGYYTGSSAAASGDGLFVPLTPRRLTDTRSTVRVWGDGSIEVPFASYPVSAVAGNVTMVSAGDAGYVTSFPAGTPLPNTSTVNAGATGDTVANGTIATVSNRGATFFSSAGTHLLFDVTGFFTGTPRTATLPAPPNRLPAALSVTDTWRLIVPSVGIDTSIGNDERQTDNGPSLLRSGTSPSGFPGGELFNIFGHRSSHGAPFLRLTELNNGDEVSIYAGGVKYGYVVTSVTLPPPDALSLLSTSRGGELQLVACSCPDWTPGCVTHRVVVTARQVSGPINR